MEIWVQIFRVRALNQNHHSASLVEVYNSQESVDWPVLPFCHNREQIRQVRMPPICLAQPPGDRGCRKSSKDFQRTPAKGPDSLPSADWCRQGCAPRDSLASDLYPERGSWSQASRRLHPLPRPSVERGRFARPQIKALSPFLSPLPEHPDLVIRTQTSSPSCVVTAQSSRGDTLLER